MKQILALCIILVGFFAYANPGKPTAAPDWTVTPKALVPDVQFWVDVFAKYGNQMAVLHDTEHLNVIYGTVDLKDLPCMDDCDTSVLKARSDRMKEAKEHVRGILLTLADNPPAGALNAEAKKIQAAWRAVTSANVFREAADEKRLRAQVGQRDRFLSGLPAAEHYMPIFETIFKNDGLPVELTRLVLVESMFNMRAISHSGASGVWQFMPGTARRYGLRLLPAFDERNDPILATYGATRMLKADYAKLGTWPLAINAYNAGCGRLQCAVNSLGTRDMTKIIRQYREGAYGFASRNYYPEFLAACRVFDNRLAYFPEMKHLPPLRYKTISITQSIPLADIAKREKTTVAILANLNPGLRDTVIAGRMPVPAAVEIRVPVHTVPVK